MGRVRVTPETRARSAITLGGVAVAGGVGWELGFGWGVLVGGVVCIGYGLWVVDVDEPKRGGRG